MVSIKAVLGIGVLIGCGTYAGFNKLYNVANSAITNHYSFIDTIGATKDSGEVYGNAPLFEPVKKSTEPVATLEAKVESKKLFIYSPLIDRFEAGRMYQQYLERKYKGLPEYFMPRE